MTVPIADHPARRIVGLAIRTSFATAGQDAGALWQRAMASGLLAAAGRPLVAVYTAYDSDHRGAYTMLVGVETDAAPRDGEEVALVPAGRYARFAADGDPAVAVPRTWRQVWAESPDLARAYVADFELYGVRGPGTADVYVGIVGVGP